VLTQVFSKLGYEKHIEVEPITSEAVLTHSYFEVGPKFGTTKVQLGADSADGADGAENKSCGFPKKIKNPQ